MNEATRELVESFSNYFESYYNFPPLTSKVYSYLLLSCETEGTTFDELVEVFNASKSSISNSLNFLTQLKYVEYFTKIEKRKRLYRITPNATLIRLERIQDLLQIEKSISEKYRTFLLEKSNNPKDSKIIKSDIYIEHLDNTVTQLTNTIQKLKSVKENH